MTIVIQRPTNKLFSLNDGLPTVFPIKCLKKLSAVLFPSLFLARDWQNSDYAVAVEETKNKIGMVGGSISSLVLISYNFDVQFQQ